MPHGRLGAVDGTDTVFVPDVAFIDSRTDLRTFSSEQAFSDAAFPWFQFGVAESRADAAPRLTVPPNGGMILRK